jgi:hypothetical protein
MLGDIMNDLRGGALYSYHFSAGRKTFVTAGLTAGFISRGIRQGQLSFRDDIDPFRGITGGGAGYIHREPSTGSTWVQASRIASGPGRRFFVMHLTRPLLSDDESDHNRLDRLLTLTGGSLTPVRRLSPCCHRCAVIVQGERRQDLFRKRSLLEGFLPGVWPLWHTNGFTAREQFSPWI